MTENCVHCGLCTKQCDFLRKYDLDIAAFAARPELAYHCFLCGECKRVCPRDIDGCAVSLAMRRQQTAASNGKIPTLSHRFSAIEKRDYLFKNYRRGYKKTVLFPGCNFPTFFPESTDKLIKLLAEQDIGVIFDCCGKPISDLGLENARLQSAEKLRQRLSQAGVDRLIVLCPNCYHYLKTHLDIEIVDIYRFLREIGITEVITTEVVPIFFPCPDRGNGELLREIQKFLPNARPIEGVQCCGLGGCAASLEPKIAAAFSSKIAQQSFSSVYTYCASCTWQLRRGGVDGAVHVLAEILDTKETPASSGVTSLINRIKRIF